MDNIGEKGLGRWLQSKFVLGAARRIYLVLASLSLVVALAALAFALFFELASMTPTPQEPVPPPYVPHSVSIDSASIVRGLQPPGNIRFVVTHPYIDQLLSADESIGYFDADTRNGLASFPNDFDIVGGQDAALFDRVPIVVTSAGERVRRAGLHPTPQLKNVIAAAIAGKSSQREFSILVVARDRFGHVSQPAKVVFTLSYGPFRPQTRQVRVPPQMDALGQVARAIALHLDSAKTTAYFDAFNRAMRVPQQCGTSGGDANFVQNFGHAFDQLQNQLGPSNIEAFYAGLCRAWKQAIADEAAKRDAAETARNAAMQRNMAARLASEAAKFAAHVARTTALFVAAGAGMAFLFISLFLAFLAIENHSDALRQAVEALANRKSA